MKNFKIFFFFLGIILMFCQEPKDQATSTITHASDSLRYMPKENVELTHPAWSKNATMYEVNIRQFTREGTFKAFEKHLPRIKEMGVDILWLMPVHPIGVKNRKGKLGSYYSVKDYYGVNPEFGTLDDFKDLVNEIHSMGMHVIIDWVANHSSWDNALVTQHPDWYTKTVDGDFQPTPWYDWGDVIDFDYQNPELRKYMTDAMKYWVKEANIDGYRCDAAEFIPIDFWDNARSELEQIKPVFMLAEAEAESRDLHKNAFDMTFAWNLWRKMHEVASDKKSPGILVGYLAADVNTFPRKGYRMTYTDNHDRNAWEGNQYSFFGDALPACIVFSNMVNGMPMVYGGQEAGLNKSISFFEKDEIEWKQHPFYDLYKKLFTLKHENQALWNGEAGGEMIRINNDKPEQVISFSREKNGDKIISVTNFAATPVTVKLNAKHDAGPYIDFFTSKNYEFKVDDEISLPAWGYLVLMRKG